MHANSICFLSPFEEQEVDGETLWLMSNVDGIRSIFPKYKQQLLFLRERERLFDASSTFNDNKENESVTQDLIPSSSCAGNALDVAVAASTLQRNQSSYDAHESNPDETLALEIPLLRSPSVMRDCSSTIPLPDSYRLNSLPSSLLKDIDSGDLSKFNSHCKNRQILIDALFYDLTINHNIWYAIRWKITILTFIGIQCSFLSLRYPSHQEYDVIVDAILHLLKAQRSKENMASEAKYHPQSSSTLPSSVDQVA